MKKRGTIAIGFMLFALFFGAGNLIFPAQLGQSAGTNVWIATFGFLLTGVGLPLLGILALAKSGNEDLNELSSKIHPVYGLLFTTLLYLTIGPFFAAPRTGTVAYEIGIAPFVASSNQSTGLLIFTALFFGFVLIFSLYPAKLVDNIGKVLAPALVVTLGIILIYAIVQPMGVIPSPVEAYRSSVEAGINGFLEGYHTMDALAALIFGILIIQIVRSHGVTKPSAIFKETSKAGLIAVVLLGVMYVGIAYLGATSVAELGIMDNGGPVLSGAATYYLGVFGEILIAIVILLACLTTAIGLNISMGEYFHKLIPKISEKQFVVVFALITFGVANFGLDNIITYSVPVLMFLYPQAIVLVLLTFLAPFFRGERSVYIAAMSVTLIISCIDGVKELYSSLDLDYFPLLQQTVDTLNTVLPLYEKGLGWLVPALVAGGITAVLVRLRKKKTVKQESYT